LAELKTRVNKSVSKSQILWILKYAVLVHTVLF